MAYAVDEKMPETLFVQLLMEKANMLKQHLKDTKSNLVCVPISDLIWPPLNYIILRKKTP